MPVATVGALHATVSDWSPDATVSMVGAAGAWARASGACVTVQLSAPANRHATSINRRTRAG